MQIMCNNVLTLVKCINIAENSLRSNGGYSSSYDVRFTRLFVEFEHRLDYLKDVGKNIGEVLREGHVCLEKVLEMNNMSPEDYKNSHIPVQEIIMDMSIESGRKAHEAHQIWIHVLEAKKTIGHIEKDLRVLLNELKAQILPTRIEARYENDKHGFLSSPVLPLWSLRALIRQEFSIHPLRNIITLGYYDKDGEFKSIDNAGTFETLLFEHKKHHFTPFQVVVRSFPRLENVMEICQVRNGKRAREGIDIPNKRCCRK
jgi:hypothetical protein